MLCRSCRGKILSCSATLATGCTYKSKGIVVGSVQAVAATNNESLQVRVRKVEKCCVIAIVLLRARPCETGEIVSPWYRGNTTWWWSLGLWAVVGFVWFVVGLSLSFSPPSDCISLPSMMTWAPCPHGVRTRGKKQTNQNRPEIWVSASVSCMAKQ